MSPLQTQKGTISVAANPSTIPVTSIQFSFGGFISLNKVYCSNASPGIKRRVIVLDKNEGIYLRLKLNIRTFCVITRQCMIRHTMHIRPEGKTGVSNIAMRIKENMNDNPPSQTETAKGPIVLAKYFMVTELTVSNTPLAVVSV